jgi:hypothetical protein
MIVMFLIFMSLNPLAIHTKNLEALGVVVITEPSVELRTAANP